MVLAYPKNSGAVTKASARCSCGEVGEGPLTDAREGEPATRFPRDAREGKLALQWADPATGQKIGNLLKLPKTCLMVTFRVVQKKYQHNVPRVPRTSTKCPKNVPGTFLGYFFAMFRRPGRPERGGGFAAAPLRGLAPWPGPHRDRFNRPG